MDYIAVVTFDDNSKTYEAASKLEGRDLGIVSAALVERDADGKVRIPESGDWDAGVATAGGSVIGLLIGVLGGPIGMLLGLTGGAAIGALVDIDRADSGTASSSASQSSFPTVAMPSSCRPTKMTSAPSTPPWRSLAVRSPALR